MLTASTILSRAHTLTIRNPKLWVFGLFVVGGFNLNFLHFFGFGQFNVHSSQQAWNVIVSLQQHPARLALASLLLLVVSVGGLIITNGSRILLALSVKSILDTGTTNVKQQFKPVKAAFTPVVKISLLTTTCMLALGLVLFAFPLLFVRNTGYQLLMFAVGGALLLPLAFSMSFLNIFTSFFVIIFKQTFGKAFSQAADLFMSHWPRLVGFLLILLLIYCGIFVLGATFIFGAQYVIAGLFQAISKLGFEQFSAIILIIRIVFALLLWFLVAGLNVFFNASLLVLFLDLVKPLETEAEAPVRALTSPTPI